MSSLNAYVLPTFEVRYDIPSIDNKTHLLKIVQNGDARSFMQVAAIKEIVDSI